jgi:hypothetical protein
LNKFRHSAKSGDSRKLHCGETHARSVGCERSLNDKPVHHAVQRVGYLPCTTNDHFQRGSKYGNSLGKSRLGRMVLSSACARCTSRHTQKRSKADQRGREGGKSAEDQRASGSLPADTEKVAQVRSEYEACPFTWLRSMRRGMREKYRTDSGGDFDNRFPMTQTRCPR